MSPMDVLCRYPIREQDVRSHCGKVVCAVTQHGDRFVGRLERVENGMAYFTPVVPHRDLGPRLNAAGEAKVKSVSKARSDAKVRNGAKSRVAGKAREGAKSRARVQSQLDAKPSSPDLERATISQYPYGGYGYYPYSPYGAAGIILPLFILAAIVASPFLYF